MLEDDTDDKNQLFRANIQNAGYWLVFVGYLY